MLRRHKVSFTDKAAGDMDDLNDKDYERIVRGCLRLESSPVPDGKHIKKLKGFKDLYRLRIGDYRAVFHRYSGAKCEYNNLSLRVMNEEDILGKVKKEVG